MTMKQRKIILYVSAIIVVVVAIVTLSVSNLVSSESEKDSAQYKKTDYRTYSYGTSTDVTASYSQLLSLYQNGQKNSYICASLELCGNSLYLNGHYAKAFEAYIMAMEMADAMGFSQYQAICYYNIGNIFVIFKDYERAAHYYEKVMDAPVTKLKRSTRSLAARYLIMCYARIGDRQKANEAYREAKLMPLSDRNINNYYEQYCRGLLLGMEGKTTAALDAQKEAYLTTEKYGLKIGMGAYPLSECGRLLADKGDTEGAIGWQRRAMQVAMKEKAYDQLDDACVALDSLYRKKEKGDSAFIYLNMHQKLSEEKLNTTEFYAARNKLMNYEDGVKTRKIDILEQKVNMMAAGLVMFLAVLAVIAFYSNKLRKAYRMLTMKNQQLIAQQDENRKLASANPAASSDDKLLKRIIEVMNDTAVVCDSDFCLQTLAKMVESNTKYVSAAISSTEQGSFKALLNEYRIREACRRLTDKAYAQYTIQAVAETVGYISVNNFIVQFKRYTGMTPSLYRKNTVLKEG